MSSIKNEISGYTVRNEVRLLRATSGCSFLLVEGSTDSQLLSRFVRIDDCSIIVCQGRENLLSAITMLEREGFGGVVGFADRDFADIVGYPEYEGIVIFTDENDLETQMLSSEALTNLLDEFGSALKIPACLDEEKSNAALLIASWAAGVGALRVSSTLNEWALAFSDMTYKFTSNTSPEICPTKTATHVIGRSKNAANVTVDVATTKVTEILATYTAWEVAHGHDCIAVLGRALRSTIGNTNEFNSQNGNRSLERTLRLAYGIDMFRETTAYKQLKYWENATGRVILD